VAREDRQRQAERGYEARAAAEANQQRASGSPPDSPRDFGLRGGSSGSPINVRIVDAQQQFFDSLKMAINGGTGPGSRADETQAMIDSQEAIAEAARQIGEEIKTLTTMMRDTQAQSANQIHSMTNFMRQVTAQTNTQISQLMTAMQAGLIGGGGGSGGGGHGPGVHGGGHGGVFPQINPQTGQPYFNSYGGIQGRFRAGMANWLQNSWGTPSVTGRGRHTSAQTQRQAAMFSRIAGGVAGGGIRGGISRIPGIGALVAGAEGVNNGMEWLTNEAAQNSRYQSIYAGDNTSVGGFFSGVGALFGGSTDDRSGIANRMAETGYVLGNRFSPGGMNEEQARAAFQGVSQLGYVGDQRDQNLAFVKRAYKNLGMDPRETLQYNQLQSQFGQNNLDSLYQSLENVSKAAQRTSQSAEVLRKSFVGNYQAALTGGAGAASTGLAGAMTMMTSTNRDLAGVSYGAGVLTNPLLQYAGAGMIGMTPGQVQGQAAQGNPFPQLASQQALTSSMLNQAVPSSVMNRMNQLIAGKGGRDKVQASGGAQYDIATDLIQHPEWNTEAVRMAMQMAGVTGIDQNSSPEQVAEAFINYQSGNDFKKQAAGLSDQYSVKMLGQGNESDNFKKFQSDLSDRQNKETVTGGSWLSDTGNDIMGWFGIDTRSDEQTAIDQGNATASAYKDLQKNRGNSGLSDPAIEAAISRFGSDPNMKIRVQTKEGDKVVSLADAIKYYPDQLTKGSASIASTDASMNKKRIGDVTGVKDVNVGPMDDSSKSQTFGDSADQWDKDNPVNGTTNSDDSGGNGKVTISLSPEVARLFNVTGSGVNIDAAAAAGVPPKPGG
jgi:hypothetical protein